jgi:hypothetical protein
VDGAEVDAAEVDFRASPHWADGPRQVDVRQRQVRQADGQVDVEEVREQVADIRKQQVEVDVEDAAQVVQDGGDVHIRKRARILHQRA